jgi:hypothetical protein
MRAFGRTVRRNWPPDTLWHDAADRNHTVSVLVPSTPHTPLSDPFCLGPVGGMADADRLDQAALVYAGSRRGTPA